MNTLLWKAVAPALAFLVMWPAGWVVPGRGSAAVQTVIRTDGMVEMLRPDGSVAATLVVEIAETPEDRARGLMGRILPDYLGGMLFVFESAQPQTFWMRNTPGSLDMMFIDAGGKIVSIAAYTTPLSDQLYSSAGPAKYVVEAKAGFADRFGIQKGFSVRWKRLH